MIYPIAICHYFVLGNENRQRIIEKVRVILQAMNTEDNRNENWIDCSRNISREKLKVLIYDMEAESSVVKISISAQSSPKHTIEQNRLTKIIIDKLIENGLCHVYSFQKLIPKKKLFSKKIKLVESLVLTGTKEACYLQVLSTVRLIDLSSINFNTLDLKLDGKFESYGYDDFENLKNEALSQKKFIDLINSHPFLYVEETFIQIRV